MKKTLFAIIVLTATALLPACAPVRSKATPRVLPDVVEYPKPVQARAAQEMAAGSCPVLSDTFMPDYLVMRDQARAARKILK